MRFAWDFRKAALNLHKHGISFEEAATVFRDTFSATVHDPDHSETEERFITFGMSSRGRLLVISHTEREEELRIISARVVTNEERRIYEER